LYDSTTKEGSLRLSLNGERYGASVSQNSWFMLTSSIIFCTCSLRTTFVGIENEYPSSDARFTSLNFPLKQCRIHHQQWDF